MLGGVNSSETETENCNTNVHGLESRFSLSWRGLEELHDEIILSPFKLANTVILFT